MGHPTGVAEFLCVGKPPHIWCQKYYECGAHVRLKDRHTEEGGLGFLLYAGKIDFLKHSSWKGDLLLLIHFTEVYDA